MSKHIIELPLEYWTEDAYFNQRMFDLFYNILGIRLSFIDLKSDDSDLYHVVIYHEDELEARKFIKEKGLELDE
tara:strand:+ start:808 stop:1029 length:222 start_codon:yes stop_codon:yes gene_type:complete